MSAGSGIRIGLRGDEKLYATLRHGMQAAADLSVAGPAAYERRERLISEAILKFRSGTFDPNQALCFVAALSENRQTVDALEKAARMADRANAQLQTKE